MYYLLFALFYLLSLLPLFVLHGIGRGIGFLVFRLIGYRRKVVMGNIQGAFPQLTAHEHRQIAHRFYAHFTDTFMETIKLMRMNRTDASRMCGHQLQPFEQIAARGQSCQLMAGHMMNWELYNYIMPVHQPLRVIAVYMRISSPAMERLFFYIRSRMGTLLVPAHQVKEGVSALTDRPYVLMLGADQSMGHPTKGYWMNFLGRPTAFPTGAAQYAVRHSLPVVYTWLEKKSRGRYVLLSELLCSNAADIGPEALTRLYARRLEQTIKEHPDNYLWSHKRWKHAWKPELASQWIDDGPMP